MKKAFIPAVIIILVAFCALFYQAFFIEPDKLVVNRANLDISNWPENKNGYKILFIGDLHTGSPFNCESKMERIVKLADKENIDIVLLVGDYVVRGVVGGKFIPASVTAKILSKIKSRQGFITILGNHDWWKDGFKIKKELEENSFVVLENQAVNIASSGEKPIWIAGLADSMERIADINKTLKQVKPGEPVIMLTHEPDILPQIPESVSLTLAGHTHGGQIRLPFIGAIFTASKFGNKYAKGYIKENGKQMFVTSGVGTSILPIRFNDPPEIVVLTIR